MTVRIAALFVMCLVAVPAVLSAQVLGNLSQIDIALSPQHPEPGEAVRAEVRSSTENVRTADVVWLVNGEPQHEGVGATTFTFTAGALGEQQQLDVVARFPGGATRQASATVTPARVTLLWEADTYTPPFYDGRARYTSGSTIRAHALADIRTPAGEQYIPEQLVYTWRRNDTVLGSQSGRGANTLVLEGPKFLGEYILSVEVSVVDAPIAAETATLIETDEPELVLYENDPLTGVSYHRAAYTDDELRSRTQTSVLATPYFMDATRPGDARLDYTWTVNGEEVQPDENNPALLTLRLESEASLSTPIALRADHAQHLLQTARAQWNFSFEGSGGGSLFGF